MAATKCKVTVGQNTGIAKAKQELRTEIWTDYLFSKCDCGNTKLEKVTQVTRGAHGGHPTADPIQGLGPWETRGKKTHGFFHAPIDLFDVIDDAIGAGEPLIPEIPDCSEPPKPIGCLKKTYRKFVELQVVCKIEKSGLGGTFTLWLNKKFGFYLVVNLLAFRYSYLVPQGEYPVSKGFYNVRPPKLTRTRIYSPAFDSDPYGPPSHPYTGTKMVFGAEADPEFLSGPDAAMVIPDPQISPETHEPHDPRHEIEPCGPRSPCL